MTSGIIEIYSYHPRQRVVPMYIIFAESETRLGIYVVICIYTKDVKAWSLLPDPYSAFACKHGHTMDL
jgi:hypothetical protein